MLCSLACRCARDASVYTKRVDVRIHLKHYRSVRSVKLNGVIS